MTTQTNPYLINPKPIELRQEILSHQEIPSYEEFLETYQGNQAIEESYQNEIADYEAKVYGPCSKSNCTCTREELRIQLLEKQLEIYKERERVQKRSFKLDITLENQFGAYRNKTVYTVGDAITASEQIRGGTGYWAGGAFVAFQQNNRERLADKVMEWVKIAEQNLTRDIDESLRAG